MAESVYKVIELVGTSSDSWEKAAKAAIERASQSLRDLRVAEVVEQDLVIEKGKVEAFRTKLKVSFKYEGKDDRAAIASHSPSKDGRPTGRPMASRNDGRRDRR